MTSTGYARYQQVDVLTMSPAQRLVALYTHLLLNLRHASRAIVTGDIGGRSMAVVKSLDVLHELLFSLDREKGGELADRLAAIYTHLIGEISAADRQQDSARLDRTIEIVASLHEAWVAAANQTD
jgi:flagellar secretion chaperone FliS